MGLLKLISNRIFTKWREKFSKNIGYLNDFKKKLSDQDKSTDSRIDNLVVSPDGGSPNEAVGARVNNRGETFPMLYDRSAEHGRLAGEQISELVTNAASQEAQVEQLNKAVQQTIGRYNKPINIYTSKDGNDQIGDGSQERLFLAIQTAINSIPLITTSSVTIWISGGVYLEGVYVNGLTFRMFVIRPLNDTSTSGPRVFDCPAEVRNIMFTTCAGYCQIIGMQIVDTANSPPFQGRQRGIVDGQSGYMAISRYKFAENTKSLACNAVYVDGTSKVNMYGSTTFIDQSIAMQVHLLSEFSVDDLKGLGNNIGAYVNAATARYVKPAIGLAITENRVIGRGLIINDEQVLS